MQMVDRALRKLVVALGFAGYTLLCAGIVQAQMPTQITISAAQPRPPVVPVISAVGSSAIGSDSATISWTTDIPSDSQVDYGPSVNYGSSTTLDPAMVTSHSQSISGLAFYTLYHYRVRSKSGSINTASSRDYTFLTPPPAQLPAINRAAIPDIRGTSAAVVWLTSTPTDSQLEYGTSTDYGSSTNLKPALTAFHGFRLTGLLPLTQYHLRAKSRDYWGNLVTSADATFETGPAAADNVYDLFYPRIALNSGTYTGIALTDLGSSSSTLDFSAFDSTGMPVNPVVSLSPPPQVLAAGNQLPVVDAQFFGSGSPDTSMPGWARIRSTGSKPVGFYLTFNGNLTQMDGAGISPSLPTTFVLPEAVGQDYTRVLLANPDVDDAMVTINLVNADGNIQKSVQTSVKGYGTTFASTYADYFPDVLPTPANYLQVISERGLIAYEYFGKNAQDFATLAGQDSAGGASTIYSPQYVIGGTWQTTLSIINLSTIPGMVSLRLVGDNGAQIGNTRSLAIGPSGKIYVSDTAFFGPEIIDSASQLQGYIEITGEGLRLAGSVVFGNGSNAATSTALPLVSTLQKSLVFSHVASSDTYFTGLAIVNPNAQDATAKIDLYGPDGTLENSVNQTVRAGGRTSRLLTGYFPVLVGQTRLSGYIRVTVDQNVACFALLGTNDLSVLSAIPAQPAQ